MHLEPKEQFGSYRIVGRLGRGAMGVVYHACDASQRDVALKVMLPEVALDEHARARFVREAEAVAGLAHRNITRVLDYGVHDNSPYIVMELLKGQTLAARLSSGEPISLETKLDIVTQLCEGLQFAHDRGIVHRDVKPANVWLLDNGGVKLLDFGVAQIPGAALPGAGDLVGSAAYMSPEQIRGDQQMDGRSDVFAAGVILYEMLTGHRPFEADSVTGVMHKILQESPPPLRSFVPDILDEIESASETALQKNVEDRYLQIADLGTDLRLARYGLEGSSKATVFAPRPIAAPPPVQPIAIPPPVPLARDVSAATNRPPAESAPPISPPPRGEAVRPATDSPPIDAPRDPGRRAASWIDRSGVALMRNVRWLGERRASLRPTWFTRGAFDRIQPFVRRPLVWLGAAAALGLVLVLPRVGARPARTPPPAALEFNVQSVPPGASVALDGVPTGQRTPALLSMTKKPARIQLSLDGFEAIDASLPAEPATQTYTLRRLLKVESEPAGARIFLDSLDTGLITPALVPLPDPVPVAVELQLGRNTRRRIQLTAAVVQEGSMRTVLAGGPQARAPAAGTGQVTTETDQPDSPPEGAPGGAVQTALVSVRVTGGYPFEVSGCNIVSAPSQAHEFQVRAPCRLQLRAPAYLLRISRAIDASTGQVEIAAPQLARVQLRSRYEWCTVILEGHAMGAPPVDVELAAGTYTAMIQCPDKTYLTRAFQIDPGRSIRRLDEFLP